MAEWVADCAAASYKNTHEFAELNLIGLAEYCRFDW